MCEALFTAGVCSLWRPIHAGHCALFSFSGQVKSLTNDVIGKPLHGHKTSCFCKATNTRHFFWRRWNFQKVAILQYLHFLYLRFSCRLSGVRPFTWPSPLYVSGEKLKCLILDYNWCNPNLDTFNRVTIRCCHGSVLYFGIFTLFFTSARIRIYPNARLSMGSRKGVIMVAMTLSNQLICSLASLAQ